MSMDDGVFIESDSSEEDTADDDDETKFNKFKSFEYFDITISLTICNNYFIFRTLV